MCTKRKYPDRRSALVALRKVRAARLKRGGHERVECAVHPCPCGAWHLTSKRSALRWVMREK